MFGPEVACKGRLRTKYIAPIYEDDVVITCAKVSSVTDNESGETVYEVEVWCENDAGKKLTVGDATIHTRSR